MGKDIHKRNKVSKRNSFVILLNTILSILYNNTENDKIKIFLLYSWKFLNGKQRKKKSYKMQDKSTRSIKQLGNLWCCVDSFTRVSTDHFKTGFRRKKGIPLKNQIKLFKETFQTKNDHFFFQFFFFPQPFGPFYPFWSACSWPFDLHIR